MTILIFSYLIWVSASSGRGDDSKYIITQQALQNNALIAKVKQLEDRLTESERKLSYFRSQFFSKPFPANRDINSELHRVPVLDKTVQTEPCQDVLNLDNLNRTGLYLSGIPLEWNTTQFLALLSSRFGPIAHYVLWNEGVAYIDFEDAQSAQQCVDGMDGVLLNDLNQVSVEWAPSDFIAMSSEEIQNAHKASTQPPLSESVSTVDDMRNKAKFEELETQIQSTNMEILGLRHNVSEQQADLQRQVWIIGNLSAKLKYERDRHWKATEHSLKLQRLLRQERQKWKDKD